MVAIKVIAVSVVLILMTTAAMAQDRAPAAPGTFRVSLDSDQHPVAGRVVGQVRNELPFRVTDVSLEVEGVDAERRTVGRTFAWAFGDVAPGGETSFAFEAMPEALSYRISVVSYDIVSGR